MRCVALLRRPYPFERTADDYAELLRTLTEDAWDIAFEGGRHTAAIRVYSEEELTAAERSVLPRLGMFDRDVLEVRFEMRLPPEVEISRSDGKEATVDGETLKSVEKGSASLDVAEFVRQLIFAANVARPGCTAIVAGFVSAEDDIQVMLPMELTDRLSLARDAADRRGWPRMRRLPVLETWMWMSRHAERPVTTRRAVNALTLIVSTNDPPVALMWAMIGLEAVYTSGHGDLLQQLRERARIFLGDTTAASRAISRMYDLRSRLVHGDLNFRGAFFANDPEDEREQAKTDEAYDVAVGILLATVQELIAREWSGVSFSTICSPA